MDFLFDAMRRLQSEIHLLMNFSLFFSILGAIILVWLAWFLTYYRVGAREAVQAAAQRPANGHVPPNPFEAENAGLRRRITNLERENEAVRQENVDFRRRNDELTNANDNLEDVTVITAQSFPSFFFLRARHSPANRPTPDLHTMFVHFDHQFFDGALARCVVEWIKRMKTCAGLCYFHPSTGLCTIR
ncbi:SprT-like domain-containing protein Spartan [Aphelenchoides fujianensis]|nr:SprT-like domain-containing protein Spartan [Aphelenchoides fujianensis]